MDYAMFIFWCGAFLSIVSFSFLVTTYLQARLNCEASRSEKESAALPSPKAARATEKRPQA